ncbi:MAG: hypothetical protein JNM69_01830 [Archangium sp.]|nr:hypothetical protein [Archangium sp.]
MNLAPEVVANVLANVSVLRSIERESLLLLAAHLEPLSVKPGAIVVREGDKADALFFVIDGEARWCVAGCTCRRFARAESSAHSAW